MLIDNALAPADLLPALRTAWNLSGEKIERIEREYDARAGSPVFTVDGRYTTRGWTEWTQGFQFGSALLQFDATGEERFLQGARESIDRHMPVHLTHVGVHDHGFNNVSTYGNLLRLAREGRFDASDGDVGVYTLALKCSGAVQAMRWTPTADGDGFVYSFNGPHSLFADTIRSMRALGVAHQLGHVLLGENDQRISLLQRLIAHARTTARYTVFYGEGRDRYDVPGRVAHECLFDTINGRFRSPATQQGYSPFSTWTRALAWILCGFAEELEFIDTLPDDELATLGGRDEIVGFMQRVAMVTCDYYLQETSTDGIPFWDTGAPGLVHLSDYRDRPVDPFNAHEPVDSSAAAIAAQGFLRFGRWLDGRGQDGRRYFQAGLTILRTLLSEPFLSTDVTHHGLLLHSVYHHPNGWDHVPADRSVPCGESSMWGDYHLREAALLVQRLAEGKPYLTYFSDGSQ